MPNKSDNDTAKKMIYLDNAATTVPYKDVPETVNSCFYEAYANPAAMYSIANNSRRILRESRECIASFLGTDAASIYFTSGGSESDNWAIIGACEANRDKGKHIITSSVEHPAVLDTCRYLETKGYEITYLPVDSSGRIDVSEVEKAIRTDTVLISIMFANNETGVLMPIKEIGELAGANHIIFHTDAVGAFGHIPINVEDLNVDMLSAAAHKMKGPRGIGLLYIRSGVSVAPLIRGGHQQKGLRAGTENPALAAGFAKAVELVGRELHENMKKEEYLRNLLESKLLDDIGCSVNAKEALRLPSHLNVSFEGIEASSLVIMLDMRGICVSAGSACSSMDNKPSHVLTAMGLSDAAVSGSIRFSLSADNTEEEILKAAEQISECVKYLRTITG